MTAPKLCPWGNLASQLPFCFIWAKLPCFAAESTEEMQFLDALASLELRSHSGRRVRNPNFNFSSILIISVHGELLKSVESLESQKSTDY